MSMDDSIQDADQGERRRWPMSLVNTVLVLLCAVGALVCFVLGQPVAGGALLAGAIGGGLGAMLARRGTSGDLERVNALEYADERDRAAAAKGLAAVGVLALVLSAGQLILHAIVRTDPLARWASIVMFFALVICWFLANWYFVRRG